MSRFFRISNCAPTFMAAATLIAPSRGSDPPRGIKILLPPCDARPGPGDAEGVLARARRRQAQQVLAQAQAAAQPPIIPGRHSIGAHEGERMSRERQQRWTHWYETYRSLEFPTPVPVDIEKRNELYEQCREVIQRHMNAENIRGIAVCISIGGQQKMLFSHGIQDENLQVKATPDMVGNISFLSKTFLMYVLLKLHEELDIECTAEDPNDILSIQDYFDFSDPMPIAERVTDTDARFDEANIQTLEDPVIATYEPDNIMALPREFEHDTVQEMELYEEEQEKQEERYVVSDETENVRLDHVMYHMSGVKQYNTWFERNRPEKRRNLEETARYICENPLNFKPGTKRNGFYDQTNFELLAYLIEHQSGRSYQDVMKDELIKLGLKNTTFHEPKRLYLNKTRGSQNEDPDESDPDYPQVEYKNATFVYYPNKVGSEGLCSTVKDLDKFFNILMTCFTGTSPTTPYPLLPDDANQMLQPFYIDETTPVKSELKDLDHGDISGEYRRGYGKALVIDGLLDKSHVPIIANTEEMFTEKFVFKQGEAMEGSSIAMLISKVGGRLCDHVYFSQAEKDKLRGMKEKPFLATIYDHPAAETDLMTREINGNTQDTNAEVMKYATVSIICTSRDKNLYILAREIGKIAFKLYGMDLLNDEQSCYD